MIVISLFLLQHLDRLDPQVSLVPLVTPVSKDLRVCPDHEDPPDLKVSKAALDVLEELDSLDNLDPKDNKVSLETLEHKEGAVRKEFLTSFGQILRDILFIHARIKLNYFTQQPNLIVGAFKVKLHQNNFVFFMFRCYGTPGTTRSAW